jgi:hypothetical protein
MSGSLARVLRLRALFENASRTEVERRTRQLARIEVTMERERALAEHGHRIWFALLSATQEELIQDAGESLHERRVLAETDGRIALGRAGRLEPLREQEARRVHAAQENYFLRRRERRQVEAVMEARAREAKIEEERRRQRSLDDWFSLRRAQTDAARRREVGSGGDVGAGRDAGDDLRSF